MLTFNVTLTPSQQMQRIDSSTLLQGRAPLSAGEEVAVRLARLSATILVIGYAIFFVNDSFITTNSRTGMPGFRRITIH
jgi:hypothetical protein